MSHTNQNVLLLLYLFMQPNVFAMLSVRRTIAGPCLGKMTSLMHIDVQYILYRHKMYTDKRSFDPATVLELSCSGICRYLVFFFTVMQQSSLLALVARSSRTPQTMLTLKETQPQ